MTQLEQDYPDLELCECCGQPDPANAGDADNTLKILLKEWAEVQKLYAKAKVNTDSAILYESARTEHALCMLRLCKRYGLEVGE